MADPPSSATPLWRTVCRLTSPARAATADIQRAHIAVCTAIDGIPAPTGGRALWAQPTPDTIVLQTSVPVPWMAWPCGWLATEPVHIPVDLTTIGADGAVRFSLIANPTMSACRVSRDDMTGHRLRGQRRAIPLPERDTWLRRRLVCLDITELVSEPLGSRHGRKHTGTVTHTLHAWHGAGAVIDPGALLHLMLNGVGPAKGYGAGLLVLS